MIEGERKKENISCVHDKLYNIIKSNNEGCVRRWRNAVFLLPSNGVGKYSWKIIPLWMFYTASSNGKNRAIIQYAWIATSLCVCEPLFSIIINTCQCNYAGQNGQWSQCKGERDGGSMEKGKIYPERQGENSDNFNNLLMHKINLWIGSWRHEYRPAREKKWDQREHSVDFHFTWQQKPFALIQLSSNHKTHTAQPKGCG